MRRRGGALEPRGRPGRDARGSELVGTTEIALLRHFPTDWNLERRLQGQVDCPLNAEACTMLAGLCLPSPWDRRAILASPLVRARETARLLADGRPVETDPRLIELGWGAWEGRRSADLLADPASGFVPTAELPWHARPPGGESAADAWARVRPLLVELAAHRRPVLLVTHKALMRVILRMAAGGPAALAPEIKRGRLYPLRLDVRGRPGRPGPVLRLGPKS